LRTPLTVLIGQIEVALQQERSGEEYRRVLGSALGRDVHIGQVVEAFMFLGRAEADAQLPECGPPALDCRVGEHLVTRPATELDTRIVEC
jgi:signal transduction histidine kinase